MGFSKFFTKRTISIIIISALFYTIFSLITDIQKISNEFASIDIFYIPLILGFHFLAMGIRSIRQKVFFDSLNIKQSSKDKLFNILIVILIFNFSSLIKA